MEDLVEAVTRGNVTQVKVVLASIATALAAYQVFLMGVGYGKVKLPFLRPKPASFAHRSIGDSLVLITIVITIMCVSYFGIEDGIEHAYDGESGRALIHVIVAISLLVVLTLKIVVVRWWHSMGRFLPLLGLTVFGLFVATWISSAGDYLVGG